MARVSLSQMFNSGLRGILNVQSQTMKTQNQIATGKRVLTPSDDPAAAARILRIEQEANGIKQYQKNIDSVESSLMLEETQLDGVSNLLVRVRELSIQAGNGALAHSERKAIAAELATRLDELHRLANTRSSTGEYIFGGYRGEQEPFVANGDNTFAFRGDAGQRYVQISDSLRVASGDHGAKIFQDVPMATVPARSAASGLAVNTQVGSASVASVAITDAAAFQTWWRDAGAAEIRITADNGDGTFAFEVFDGGGVQIGPDSDADGTIDPLSFVTGTPPGPLTFGGAELSPSENPALNDVFRIAQPGAAATISAGQIHDVDAFNSTFVAPDTAFTMRITGVTAPDQYHYEIVGGSGPVTGSFQAGDAFQFGGAEFRIVDAAVGAEFELSTPSTQSILDTMGKLVTGLSELGDSDNDKLRLKDLIADTLSNLDNAEDNVGAVRAEVGARLNTLDTTRELHEGVTLVNNKVLAEIRDLDYAEAITRLTQENFVLQAAQQSFAKISKLSLFDFLR